MNLLVRELRGEEERSFQAKGSAEALVGNVQEEGKMASGGWNIKNKPR